MASNTLNAFFLGTYADVDPNESNCNSENASTLVGEVFGSAGSPAWKNHEQLTLNDPNGDEHTYDNDYGSGNTITFAGDTVDLDSSMIFNVTVTYTDATTDTTQVLVLQDAEGRVFIAPHRPGNTNNDALTAKPMESISLDSVAGASYDFVYTNLANLTYPCFAPGTLIQTPNGPRAVETLCPGDLVTTLDHGPQAIRWVRSVDQPLQNVETDAKPVLIEAGALGAGCPSQAMIVSPQHRILVGGEGQLDGWFKTEAFAPAKSLTMLPRIRHMKGKQDITWSHFACGRHEIVTANGCLSESLLLGAMVVNGLTATERRTLTDIFGSAQSPDAALNGPPARECLKVGEVRRYFKKFRQERRGRIAKDVGAWNADLAMEQWDAERLKNAKFQAKSIDLASRIA